MALEFSKVFQEEMGSLADGYMKLSDSNLLFKNKATGKLMTLSSKDVDRVDWQKLGNKPGLKIVMADGTHHRFGGFKSDDFSKLSNFISDNWHKNLQKKDLALKGWNYGETEFEGKNLLFKISDKAAFELPLSNVMRCVGTKSEAILEFHANDECPVQLTEMRLHIPQDPDRDRDNEDPVEEFRKAVMQFAEAEGEEGMPIVTLPEVLCATPRGRYEIKVYQTYLFFHGKSYDYKIPLKTITRMFLLPHKDGRHMFFVLHINPPIRQGQTRYPFLVLEFSKDEEIEVELGLNDEQIKSQYNGKLDTHMKGIHHEIVARLFRVIVNSRIIVPGNFVGASGTPAISCALRQSSGFLYPLEKGFVYVHKPPLYIRFEEIDNVHFARSDVSTRSFDFEILQKSGNAMVFSSVGKEEYNKLFDYVQSKGLKIRNAQRLGEVKYREDKFADSSDGEELDPYAEKLKKDAKQRGNAGSSDSEDDDYDVEKDLNKKRAQKSSSEGSGSEPEEEYDSEGSGSGVSDDLINHSPPKKAKKTEEKKEKSKTDGKKNKSVAKTKDGKNEKTKKEKDPNAPKRNQTAFFIWQQENRSKIKQPGDTVAATASRAGAMWKSMSEDEKRPYEKKSKEDKERYDREMREYQASGGAASSAAKPSSSKGAEKKKAAKKETVASQSKPKSKEIVEDSDDDSSDSDAAKSKQRKESSSSISDDSDLSD